ncbi:flagellar basal body-associated FliL family protein [Rhizobium sp. ZX09]|uniref:flagellar basal body-associated FliL family protein n=1 Tax=Rhizobium sp. ZX09 TaxID=2291939 RepID=UPI001A99DC31|nr:flagellar basal body-associated FliL family protein [Rhizobium sp. ZX09]QSZ55856.1 flagellar basal body protein FliL [Rhizobium sp. ZX09]
MENEQAEGKKKSSPLIMTIAGVVILTLLGAGGGWLVGGMIAPKIAATEAHATAAAGGHGEKKEEGVEKIAAEPNRIVQLDPITTNLAYPSTNWVRLEVALMFKGPVEVGLAEDIHQDIIAYVRTVSLQQLEGPRGFQYLKDDIQERVDLRSQGRVSKVMFRTFVIE